MVESGFFWMVRFCLDCLLYGAQIRVFFERSVESDETEPESSTLDWLQVTSTGGCGDGGALPTPAHSQELCK